MKIPGAAARHAIITDVCRSNRTDMGAFDEAVDRLRESYIQAVEGWRGHPGVQFHLVLTVERPQPQEGTTDGITGRSAGA